MRRLLATSDPGAGGTTLTADDGYRLDLEHHHLDTHRFELLLHQARLCRDTDPSRAAEQLAGALVLWRGVAFGDLATHPLIRPEAVHLDELRAAAAGDRIDARLAVAEVAVLVCSNPGSPSCSIWQWPSPRCVFSSGRCR